MKKHVTKRFLKKLSGKIYKPILETYLKKERTYNHRNIHLKILPGVFHPGFFFSTKILLDHIETYNLKGKTFLELGAGSGLIAISSVKKGAIVTATDMSSLALENIGINKQLNHVAFNHHYSDLFDQVPKQIFDYIVINPPYYRGKIRDDASLAWYAGEQLDYFQKLFQQLPDYMSKAGKVLMILSDECEIDEIQNLASVHRLSFRKIFAKKLLWETNFIFEIHFKI